MQIKNPINNSVITLQFFIETLQNISINTNTNSTKNISQCNRVSHVILTYPHYNREFLRSQLNLEVVKAEFNGGALTKGHVEVAVPDFRRTWSGERGGRHV